MRGELLYWERVLVVKAECPHGHAGIHAHAEADENALLNPRVDAPAGDGGSIGLGGANLSLGQTNQESGEEASVFECVAGGLAFEELFDFSSHGEPEGRPIREPP